MKRYLSAVLLIAALVISLCSCGTERIYEQTGNLGYEIEAGWTSKTVTPAPSTMKQYDYNDYYVMVGNVSYFFYEDPLLEALEYAVGGTEMASDGASFDDYTVVDIETGGMPAKEASVSGSGGFFGIFTAVETEKGVYVFATVTEDPEQEGTVEKNHDALKETVIFSDEDDGEVYAGNVLQFSDYISQVPAWDSYVVDMPWWTSRTLEYNGVINYIFGSDISSLKIAPMDSQEVSEEVIHETLSQIYDGKIAPAATCTLSGKKELKCAIGSAVYYVLDLHFGDDKSNTVKASAVFVLDENGQAVCCLSNTSDSDLTYDYSGILDSMQAAAPVKEQVDTIYGSATEYAGDNTAVSNLLEAVGFGNYGDYIMELKTSKEPYGLIVRYKGNVRNYDFQREAVMMLGLVENLGYIEIKDADSNIVRYDTDVTKSLLMYDVKQMSRDKAVLEAYYLETLYRHQEQ